jgi:hypothetical protein
LPEEGDVQDTDAHKDKNSSHGAPRVRVTERRAAPPATRRPVSVKRNDPDHLA